MSGPIAQVQVSVNAGSYTSGGVSAAAGSTLAFRQNPALATPSPGSYVWTLQDYPRGFSLPAGWVALPTGQYISTAATPPTITLPAAGQTTWGKITVLLQLNGNPPQMTPMGSLNPNYVASLSDAATIVGTTSPRLGMPGIAYPETTQFDAVRSWPGQWTQSLRQADVGGVSGTGPSGLSVSPVDMAVGYGQTGGGFIYAQPNNFGVYYGQTSGVGFGVTQAGRYCLGARYWWGDGHTLRISLWTPGSGTTPLAYATGAGLGGGLGEAVFASPVALTPGQPYAITYFDTTTPTSNASLGPGYYHYIGSNGYSQPNMGNFVPHPRAPASTLWGPFSMGVNFFADGATDFNNIYGLYWAGTDTATDTCPNSGSIFWYPIEPMLV